MAFEIYNGTAANRSVSEMNKIIDKLAEMWEFDSVDETSALHSVTYGDCVLSVDSSQDGAINITADGTSIFSTGYRVAFDAPYQYTIVKASNAIMLSMNYDPGVFTTVIIGTTTNINGGTGKGMLFVDASQNAAWNAGCGSDIPVQENDTVLSSDTNNLTQLMQYSFSVGGWYFDNAYRLMRANDINKHELCTINGERYFVSMRTAIKEE